MEGIKHSVDSAFGCILDSRIRLGAGSSSVEIILAIIIPNVKFAMLNR